MQARCAVRSKLEDEVEEIEAARDRLSSKLTLERMIEVCECVIDIAAAMFNVSGRELRSAHRNVHGVARVRQIAMYVTHVTLRLSMTDVGRGFGRDRTTVMYACHLIEDLRDDEDFDRIVQQVEAVIVAAFRGRDLLR